MDTSRPRLSIKSGIYVHKFYETTYLFQGPHASHLKTTGLQHLTLLMHNVPCRSHSQSYEMKFMWYISNHNIPTN